MAKSEYQKFEDFGLTGKLQEAVAVARFDRPTELQQHVIPLALARKDVIFEAKSGMGKSACFAIPFLQHWLRERTRKAIIVTPSPDGVRQISKVISRLCPTLRANLLKFTQRDDYFYPEDQLKCPIIILEFGVLERFIKREKEYMEAVRSVGLDDFDSLLLQEDKLNGLIRQIRSDRQMLISVQKLNEQSIEKARWYCDANKFEKVKLLRPETKWAEGQVSLRYAIADEEDERFELLTHLMRENSGSLNLIITESDRISRHIAEELRLKGFEAGLLEYSMQLDEKQSTVDEVSGMGKGILVGCEASLNGLGLTKVNHLVSWTLPQDLESYWTRLDRFTGQGELNTTVLVSQSRAGAIKLLERRLGREMICLNPREVASADRKTSRSRASSGHPGIKEHAVDEGRSNVIPNRFHLPVFGGLRGPVRKTLGSKFVPARKKR